MKEGSRSHDCLLSYCKYTVIFNKGHLSDYIIGVKFYLL